MGMDTSNVSNPIEIIFHPLAYARLKKWRDLSGKDEMSCLCITDPDDPTYIQDVRLVKQRNSGFKTEFDDDALAEYQSQMLKAGLQPRDYMGIWIHTHPFCEGTPNPSGGDGDEETFQRILSVRDWGVMIIIGKEFAQAYVRVRVNKPFPLTLKGSVGVDWRALLPSMEEAEKEYKEAILPPVETFHQGYGYQKGHQHQACGYDRRTYGKKLTDKDIPGTVKRRVYDTDFGCWLYYYTTGDVYIEDEEDHTLSYWGTEAECDEVNGITQKGREIVRNAAQVGLMVKDTTSGATGKAHLKLVQGNQVDRRPIVKVQGSIKNGAGTCVRCGMPEFILDLKECNREEMRLMVEIAEKVSESGLDERNKVKVTRIIANNKTRTLELAERYIAKFAPGEVKKAGVGEQNPQVNALVTPAAPTAEDAANQTGGELCIQ
jgi:hypothetical protein